MKFDFSKAPGLSAEALKILNDPKVVDAMDTESDAQLAAQVAAQVKEKEIAFEESKKNFKTKMDALDEKRKQAEKDLKAALEKKTGNPTADELKAAQLEATTLKGQLEALQTEREKLAKDYEKTLNSLQQKEHESIIHSAVTTFNQQNKEIQVNPEFEDVLSMYAKEHVKLEKDDKGQFVPKITKFDGTPLTTAEGLGTPVDWLNYLRNEKPAFFTAPSGSGASGSRAPSGGTEKTMARADFEALTPQEKGTAAAEYTIVD